MLSKEYLLQCTVDTDNPIGFDGPEIYKSTGCDVQWKPGMDLTESAGEAPVSDAFLLNQMRGSFFNIFKLSKSLISKDGRSDHLNSVTTLDFKIESHFKKNIIPSAMVMFSDERAILLRYQQKCRNQNF